MRSKFGFYKVGTGIFLTHVGDVKKNTDEIIKLIKKAEDEKVNVLVFPELALVGYTSQDLLFHKELIDDELSSLKEIIKLIPQQMIVFVGGIINHLDRLYNVAFALSKDKILGIVPKSYIPNYNEFYEKRWFSAGISIYGL